MFSTVAYQIPMGSLQAEPVCNSTFLTCDSQHVRGMVSLILELTHNHQDSLIPMNVLNPLLMLSKAAAIITPCDSKFHSLTVRRVLVDKIKGGMDVSDCSRTPSSLTHTHLRKGLNIGEPEQISHGRKAEVLGEGFV